MTYKNVYSAIQTYKVHIPRNVVRDVVLKEVGVPKIRAFSTSMDVTKCRGFYLPVTNTNHPFVKMAGTHIIVLARDLNRCWTRFVFVKELMHFLDGAAEATDSGDAFEQSLTELTGPGSPKASPQTIAEVRAFWMALGVLCPESIRRQMKAARQQGHMTDYQIALQLMIPEQYVPRLFSSIYESVVLPFIK